MRRTLLLLFCLTALAGTAQPKAKLEKDTIDFGIKKETEGLSLVFKITNTGNRPLLITQIERSSSVACSYTMEPIAPGGHGEVKISFNLSGKMGVLNKIVTVKTN